MVKTINAYFEEINRMKYLTIVSTNKSKFKNLIQVIN